MSAKNLQTAQARIAACLQLDGEGPLQQRRDYLNLAGLELTSEDLTSRFDPEERGLPEIGLADLVHLRYLDLTGNRLAALPECVTGFHKLVWLGLNFNHLKSLPADGWENLNELKRLYLRGNRLRELPLRIGLLKELVELDLVGNPLTELPITVGQLGKLEHLGLDREKLVADQLAAWKQRDWKALRKHLLNQDSAFLQDLKKDPGSITRLGPFAALGIEPSSIQQASSFAEVLINLRATGRLSDAVRNFAAKVIIIGERDHGKTCLQQALRGLTPSEGNPSTIGMNRERLRLKKNGSLVAKKPRSSNHRPDPEIIDLQLWDMGGQHDYRHMHQLLFSQRAIYLAVSKPRAGASYQELEEWLDLINRRTGGEASVIVVFTFKGSDPSVKLERLREKFPQLNLVAIRSVDSISGFGIQALRECIAQTIQSREVDFARQWPQSWLTVFEELETGKHPYIAWDRFAAICNKHGLGETDEEALSTLALTGHLVGSWLWRQDTPAGKEVLILQPDWLNRAVARIVDDQETRKAGGLIAFDRLHRLWETPATDGAPGFPGNTHEMLIQLMEVNELAYRPRIRGKASGQSGLLLITQLVEDKSKDEIERAWQKQAPKEGQELRQIIAFVHPTPELGFGEVPELIYLLIFRLRDFSLGQTDHRKSYHWQRGLIVKDSYGSVGLIELKNNELHITVRCTRTDFLFYAIGRQIGGERDDQWNGLLKKEFVLCGDQCTRTDQNKGKGRISWSACHKNLDRRFSAINCSWGGCEEVLDIERLLRPSRYPTFVQSSAESSNDESKEDQLLRMVTEIHSGETKWQQKVDRSLEQLGLSIDDIRQTARMHADTMIAKLSTRDGIHPTLFSVLPVKKNWLSNSVSVTVDITVWCEWSLMPVPFFSETSNGCERGKVRVEFPRQWLRHLGTVTRFARWALLVAQVAPINVSSNEESTRQLNDLLKRTKAIGDEVEKLTAEANRESTTPPSTKEEEIDRLFEHRELLGLGIPTNDQDLMRVLAKRFEKEDSDWGGLDKIYEGSSFYWVHPEWEKFGRVLPLSGS